MSLPPDLYHHNLPGILLSVGTTDFLTSEFPNLLLTPPSFLPLPSVASDTEDSATLSLMSQYLTSPPALASALFHTPSVTSFSALGILSLSSLTPLHRPVAVVSTIPSIFPQIQCVSKET